MPLWMKSCRKKKQTNKNKMPKTTCIEVKAFIPSRAPFLAYGVSEVVPPAGYASSSDSWKAAPQATRSKESE